MSAIRNVFFMGSSTAVRLGFAMLTSVMMARALGPQAFGEVMYWLSLSGLLCMVANFGFSTFVLRELGANPARGNAVMGNVFSAKLILSLLVLMVVLCAFPWLEPTARALFLLLAGAMLADSMTEFFNVGFRATNRFAAETRLATVSSVLQCLVVGAALLVSTTALAAAIGFLASRLLVTAMTWQALRQYFAGIRPGRLADACQCIRQCLAYGVDYGLQGLFGQADSLLLNHFMGKEAVGVYQAGMRLFLGGAQAASVLANVFLPRAAAAAGDAARFQRESRLVQLAFVGVGAAFGLVLAAFPVAITTLLFGARYLALAPLLPWFGLLFFVRLFASSWGIILTSAGEQGFRAWANVAMWALLVGLAIRWIPRFGAAGWLMGLVCGYALLGALYMGRGLRSTPLCKTVLASAGACGLAFLPFTHLPVVGS